MGATESATAPETEYERTTARRSRILFPIIAVILIGAIGLSLVDMVGQSDHETAVVSRGIANATTTARDFGFVPALIRVPPGVPLRLRIQNQGVHVHTFTIESLGIDEEIRPGTTIVLILHLPAKVGQFVFYDRSYAALGMRGKIVIQG